MESHITDSTMQSSEIYPQLPSPDIGGLDQQENEPSTSPSHHPQLLTPPPSSDSQLLSTDEQESQNIELDSTGIDYGYDDNVFMYMSDECSTVDSLIDQLDSIPTCEELCQTLNNYTDSYVEQTVCPSCGQAYFEGTLWCITCDSDQIIVDGTWTENAELGEGPNDMTGHMETVDYNEILNSPLDNYDTDQKRWADFFENGMFLNTDGGEGNIDGIGHFVYDSNLYSLSPVYSVETLIQ